MSNVSISIVTVSPGCPVDVEPPCPVGPEPPGPAGPEPPLPPPPGPDSPCDPPQAASIRDVRAGKRAPKKAFRFTGFIRITRPSYRLRCTCKAGSRQARRDVSYGA